jgi:glycosyltransferase involved in cell wall biosynthesis
VIRIGLFLSAEPHSGGVFQYSLSVLEAVSALPQHRFDVVAAYLDPQWRSLLAERQVRSIWLDGGSKIQLVGRLFSLFQSSFTMWRNSVVKLFPPVKALLAEQCRLWIFPAGDDWATLLPVPSLGAIHDLMHRYEPSFPETRAHGRFAYRERYFRATCQFAKGMLVDSEVGKQQVVESYGAEPRKLFVLPYVASPAIVSQAPVDLDSSYRLPPKFIFYPAQFWQHKNHGRLIAALDQVRRQHPDICLVLVGSKKNGYEAALAAVRTRGLEEHVWFTGYVPDEHMAEFYRRARALVMPTFFGPTNIPPLEAFAIGCPVAVSGIYGMSEQVGSAALLLDPKSVEAIADCMTRMWTDDDLCRTLVARGKEKSLAWNQSHFNVRFQEILRDLLPTPPRCN